MTEHRCNCRACWPGYEYFVVCKTCGNKRCPKATDHELACTGSNDAEQAGSVFGPRDKLSERYLKAREEWLKDPLPDWMKEERDRQAKIPRDFFGG